MLWHQRKRHVVGTVMACLVLFCFLLSRPVRYAPSGSKDPSRLLKYSFEDKYKSSALQEVPLALRDFEPSIDPVFESGCRDPMIESKGKRVNAAFVVLARNKEIDGVILSMRSLERHFNQWFNYKWVFLNDEPFNEEFKRRVEEVASGEFEFGIIPPNKWQFPNGNTPEFKESIESQGDRGIMYGSMKSYHSMCRFYSGYFFEHPLVKNLDWYWRVEPDVDFYCDLTYDPFVEMEKNGKKYGYTIAIKELVNTVPSLFRKTKEFIKTNNLELPDSWNFFINNYEFFKGENKLQYQDVKNVHDLITKMEKTSPMNLAKKLLETTEIEDLDKNLLNELVRHSTTEGFSRIIDEIYNFQEYNLCHFWSNFEIASNSIFTSPEYRAYYDFLERSKGFYQERWGDAPIHSLAVGMFLDLDEIHYFRDIGYKHSTLAHCPFNSPNQLPYKSSPKFKHQFLPSDEEYYAHPDEIFANGVGCRCRCPSDHEEIENSGGSCSNIWAMLTSNERHDLRMKKSSRKLNDDGTLSKDQRGILGIDDHMDLDRMETQAAEWLSDWVKKGKKVEKFEFSKSQRRQLEGMFLL